MASITPSSSAGPEYQQITDNESLPWEESHHSASQNESGLADPSEIPVHPLADPNLIDPAIWNMYNPRPEELEYISDLLFAPGATSQPTVGLQPQWQPLPHFEQMPLSDVSAMSFGVPSMLQNGPMAHFNTTTDNMFDLPNVDFTNPSNTIIPEPSTQVLDHLHLEKTPQVQLDRSLEKISHLDQSSSSPLKVKPLDEALAAIDFKPTKGKTPRVPRSKAKDPNKAIVKRKPRGEVDNSHRACWRCKRYKKPCTGKGSICDTCVTSGFRIWPSALGCRRGNLESFIEIIFPGDAAETLKGMDAVYVKPFSWRHGPRIYPSDVVVPEKAKQGDIWDRLKYHIQSTAVHGPGILELVEIGATHQRKKSKPDQIMTSAAHATSLVIDFYHTVISTEQESSFDPSAHFSELFKKTRKVSLAALDIFLRTSLTGRLKDWFPTFIGGVILVYSYILIADSVAAIPAQFRKAAWPDLQKNVLDLRHYLYSTAQDLLSVLAKGSKLLDLTCWVPPADSPAAPIDGKGDKIVRNAEGMRMMDQDEATYDAMRELQLWREEFSFFLSSDSWMTTLPFTVDYLPIMSFSRMFQFTNRG